MTRVLVVDDHPGMLELLTLQMQMLGLSVTAVRDAESAIQKALEEIPAAGNISPPLG